MFYNILAIASRDLLVTVINFGISIILARALDKDVLGTWFALQTLFLISDSCLRYRSDIVMVLRFKSGENFASVGSQFMIAAASTFIILVLALTCSDLFFDQIQRFVPIDNPWTIMAVLISLSFSILVTTYIYYLTAQKSFQKYNFLLICQTLVNLTVVVIVILFGNRTVMSPVLGQLAAWAVFLPLAINTLISVRRDANWSEIRALGKEGISFQFNSFLATFQIQSPRLFALFFLTSEDIAEVGLLFVLVSLMLKYPAAINTVFFAETKKNIDFKNYRPTFLKLGLVTLLISLLLFFFSPLLVSLSFGPSYSELGNYFQSIIIFVVLHSLAVVLMGLRNIVGDYRSMNICIGLGVIFQWLYLWFAQHSLETVVSSYAVFSLIYFCLSCFFTRSNLREILH